MKRSSVRVLKGILKKPRRFSKFMEFNPSDSVVSPDGSPRSLESVQDGIEAQISETHSDDGKVQCKADEGVSATPQPKDTAAQLPNTPRAALQLHEFDRMLFAIRGAQLRDEYMKDNRRQTEAI